MSTKKVLLVEGFNDKGVIQEVLNAYGVDFDFDIKVCDSVDNMPDEIRLRIMNPSAYAILGIVADADTSTHSRWQQIRNILHNTGLYNCKRLSLSQDGNIVLPIDSDAGIKFGAWIMPNNEYSGALEDFLLEMVPADDTLMSEVEDKLSEFELKGRQRYPLKFHNKAKIQTFLAWERKPGISVSTAIKAHILNPHTPTADRFVEWIKNVFEL